LLENYSNYLLEQCLVLLGVAIWRLMVLENQVLVGQDLKHSLHEAMVELLSVVLHHNISVSSYV
jgi:hypothetical protein